MQPYLGVIPMITEMRNILATNLGGYCCHGTLAYLHKICEMRNTKCETFLTDIHKNSG